jgi:Glyoxalase-like domain
MVGIAQLGGVVLECPDPRALASFYSQLIGWQVIYGDDDWVMLGESDAQSVRLSFQRAPGYKPPVWPDPASSMQVHLDLRVDDLDSAEQSAMRLGATKFDHQPDPANFRVMADPAGHPFCVCTS